MQLSLLSTFFVTLDKDTDGQCGQGNEKFAHPLNTAFLTWEIIKK
jgi:hypothetical protein